MLWYLSVCLFAEVLDFVMGFETRVWVWDGFILSLYIVIILLFKKIYTTRYTYSLILTYTTKFSTTMTNCIWYYTYLYIKYTKCLIYENESINIIINVDLFWTKKRVVVTFNDYSYNIGKCYKTLHCDIHRYSVHKIQHTFDLDSSCYII